MTQIIENLAEISGRYDAVFCDLWGCLHNGKTPFPTAVAALQAYRAQGGVVLLLTNSPRPKPSVVNQLRGLGVPDDCYDEIVSSGDAAQYALITGAVGRKVFAIGADKDEPLYTEFAADLQDTLAREEPITRVPLDQAEGLVVTGPFDDRKDVPEDYRATFLYAKTKGMKMLCANPDLEVDLGETRIYCAGALAALYEEMGGEALYFGKPHPPIYDLARRRLAAINGDIGDGAILCIGDGVGTDIKGGFAEGLDTLFITSGLSAAEFGPNLAEPHPKMLQDFLDQKQLDATYSLPTLR